MGVCSVLQTFVLSVLAFLSYRRSPIFLQIRHRFSVLDWELFSFLLSKCLVPLVTGRPPWSYRLIPTIFLVMKRAKTRFSPTICTYKRVLNMVMPTMRTPRSDLPGLCSRMTSLIVLSTAKSVLSMLTNNLQVH